MADTWDLSTYAGRQAARDAGNWVGADSSGNVVLEAGHPGGQASVTSSPASIGGSAGGGVSSDQQSILDAFKASSGFSQQQLAQNQAQFQAQLDFQKQQWEQAGLPTALVNIKVQEATIQQIMNQIQMAQANLGLSYLGQAAQLGGPSDYFQQSNFFRGAQGNPGVPTFLSALQNGLTMPAFGATGDTAPIAQNMDTLAQQLTGGATPGVTNTPASATPTGAATGPADTMRALQSNPAASPTAQAAAVTGTPVNQAIAGSLTPTQQDRALGLIGAIGRTGGTGLAPQALEQLTPDEMALFGSGLKASGFSLPSFLQSYQQSRVGQRAAIPLG